MSIVMLANYQRPSVACSMTLKEFVQATRSEDGHTVVFSKHRTSTMGTAQVALTNKEEKFFGLLSKK